MIFKRSFIYLKAINSVIIIDSFIGQKETEITSTYNLAPTLNCQKSRSIQFNYKFNQAGEDEPFCQAKGFCVITGEKKFYIFVICGDIVKGNKLLVSMVNFLWPTCFD